MSIVIENMRQKDIRPPPCEIDYKNFKFLITDRPTDQTMQNYIQVRNSDIHYKSQSSGCIWNNM